MTIPCVDCGCPLPANAVGCPNCARNIRAERRLARIGLAAVLGLVAVTAAVLVARRINKD